MHLKITSKQNPKIKDLVRLQTKSKERIEQGQFVIEGVKETRMAIENDYEILAAYYCKEIADKQEINLILSTLSTETLIYEVDKEIYSKISYRNSTIGLIAVAKSKLVDLVEVKLSANPLLLVLEKVEKPGNIGAMLRTADAAAMDAVIICDSLTDLYNPNVIRSSVGCVFSTQVVLSDSDSVQQWLKQQKITPYTMSLQAESWYYENDFTNPTAFVMGTESIGLSTIWQENTDCKLIKIPMQGKNDSLNVSTSAAIAVFEAKRQRNFIL